MTQTASSPAHYSLPEVSGVIEGIFLSTGMEADKAKAIAHSLLSADSMGHGTHGLVLAPWYLEAARSGLMTITGDVTVVNDRGNCITWNGRRLPGAWLISRAVDTALERVAQHGIVSIAIANSHHAGALAVYLPRLTECGLLVQLACSGPAARGVAPFGGREPLFTTNPMAAGIPTHGDPVLSDVSSSITTLNSARQLVARGQHFPGQWAMDKEGQPSDDPNVVITGGGTLLPVGGFDHGHKGYSMAILAETLTQALPGYGRADEPKGTCFGIYLQVTDPNAFAGIDAFTRQSQWLVDACHANMHLPGRPKVRMPGENALKRQRQAQKRGVPLIPETVQALLPLAEAAGLVWPEPIAS